MGGAERTFEAEKPERGAVSTIKELGIGLIPFSWVKPEMKALGESQSGKEFGLRLGMVCAFAGLDTAGIISAIPSAGTATALTATAKAAIKMGIKTYLEKQAETLAAKFGKIGAKRIIEDLSENVAKNAPMVVKNLEAVRLAIPAKNDAVLWKALNGEIAQGLEKAGRIARFTSKDMTIALKNGTEFSFLVLDKSGTWKLNNLSKEWGDLGLKVYFEAALKVYKKYEPFGAKIVKTTNQGDELVFILQGKSAKMGAQIAADMNAEAMAIVKQAGLKFSPAIQTALAKFSNTEIRGTARISKKGTVDLVHEGRVLPLETLLSKAETREVLAKLSSESVRALEPFTRLKHGEMPKFIEEVVFDRAITVRFGFDAKRSGAMLEMTGQASKGVANVEMNNVGPSVLNLLGHATTDHFTSTYYRALTTNLEKAGVKADVYSAGPLAFGFKFNGKVNEAALKKALDTTERQVGAMLEKSLGVNEVKTTSGFNKTEAERKMKESVFGTYVSDKFTQKSGEMISRLHFEKPIAESEIASRLSGLNFTTRDKVLKLVRQTPEWARDDVGMYQHLYRNGISREILPNIMERIAGQQISETALSGVRVMKIQ